MYFQNIIVKEIILIILIIKISFLKDTCHSDKHVKLPFDNQYDLFL